MNRYAAFDKAWFAILGLLLGIVGCTLPITQSPMPTPLPTPTYAPGETEWERAKRNGPPDMTVSGAGFDEATPPIERVGSRTFQLPPNIPITLPFHLASRSGAVEHHRFLIFLNEVQLQGALGDDSEAWYADIAVQPGEEITLTLKIPPLPEGAHDLILIDVLEPNQPLQITDNRNTLLVGASRTPLPRTYLPLENVAVPIERLGFHLNASPDPQNLKEWLTTEATIGQHLDYWLFSDYETITYSDFGVTTDVEQYEFAVVALFDYQPIAIHPQQPIFYGAIPRASKGVIAGQVTPTMEGSQTLLLLRIDFPGLIMDEVYATSADHAPSLPIPYRVSRQFLTINVKP